MQGPHLRLAEAFRKEMLLLPDTISTSVSLGSKLIDHWLSSGCQFEHYQQQRNINTLLSS